MVYYLMNEYLSYRLSSKWMFDAKPYFESLSMTTKTVSSRLERGNCSMKSNEMSSLRVVKVWKGSTRLFCFVDTLRTLERTADKF